MLLVGSLQDLLSFLIDLHRKSVMDGGRRHQGDTCMTMFLVVPIDKRSCPRSGILDGAETLRIVRSILHGLELDFVQSIQRGYQKEGE